MRILLIIFLLVFSISCSKVEKKSNAILDLIAVSGDTLIGAKLYSGIIITTDGGKSWIEKAKTTNIKQITIDNNGILWGLDSWIGIHEKSYSRLLFSTDYGSTWKTINFDIEHFFPTSFFSKPHENLSITTYDKKIYKLNGNNYEENWLFVRNKIDEDNKSYSLPFRISNDSLLKLDKNGSWFKLVKIPEISIPFQIIQSQDTIFIATGGYGGYKALFATVTNDSIVTNYEMAGIQALGIIRDSKGRIWTFGDGGIFVLQHDKLIKVY